MNNANVLDLRDWGRRFNGWFGWRLGIKTFDILRCFSRDGRFRNYQLDGIELWRGRR